MQYLIYFCLAVYFGFYIFEAPIRYAFHLIGIDSLIFIRDIILIFPMLAIITIRQVLQKKLQPVFYVFVAVIIMHGIIGYLNIGSFFVILYSVKVLINLLIGVIVAPYIMNPSRSLVIVVFIAWLISFAGVAIDKYDIIAYPWTGMETTIGDVKVDISRNWTLTGFDKRAGGLMRSSINVAAITPLLALILLFNVRSFLLKATITIMTLFMLYWTTQKASIVAFAAVAALVLLFYRRPIPVMKIVLTGVMVLMIALPIIMPQFTMPSAGGTFSMSSFYLRVEEMWPQAWQWIENKELFPFGVGLGGIGGAMRFYYPENVNAADNMFVFLYAYFGMFSLLYLWLMWWACVNVSNKNSSANGLALSTVLFICFYGIALSMIEDQMSTLFLGAAVGQILIARKEKNAG